MCRPDTHALIKADFIVSDPERNPLKMGISNDERPAKYGAEEK